MSDDSKNLFCTTDEIMEIVAIGRRAHLLGAIRAITTALHDTIEDPTLPNHLRKAQLRHLLEYVEELGRAVGK